MESYWLFGSAVVGGLIVALTPLIIELAALVLARPRLPHPSALQFSRSKDGSGGPHTKEDTIKGEPKWSLLIEFTDDTRDDPWLWCIRTGDSQHYRVMIDGHCTSSELPSVLLFFNAARAGFLSTEEGAHDAGWC